MRTETTKKRRRISKAERQRQKLIITGGMAIIVLILVIALGIFVFGSCGTDYTETDMNTVYVLKDGKIVSTDLESFDASKYDQTKLESYVAGMIDTYNKENGEDSIVQKEFSVEENIATLVLEYVDTDAFEAINGVELFVGSLEEAKKAGYSFAEDITFAKMVDGKAMAAVSSDFADNVEYKVIVIKSNTKVVVPGEICYVSTENIAKVGKDYVVIKDGCQLLTEGSSIGTENETEPGTEIEGAVGEDEVEGGDGEIIFDFGDEPETETTPNKDVITYIIYK